MLPEKAIQRLSVYRRLLRALQAERVVNVYSHELASMAGVTAAQVRRDLMTIGYSGTPTRGYSVQGLIEHIGQFLDAEDPQRVALVGIGIVGQALLAHFAERKPNLSICAAFDSNPQKVGRVIHGCRCYPVDRLAEVIDREGISVVVITVPATAAQGVVNTAVAAGVRGILNFSPARLRVPAGAYVEDVDLTVSLEKVAFFARQSLLQRETIR